MALGKHEVVPIDTHVFQITAQFYMPKYANNSKKKSTTVSKAMHEEIGLFFSALTKVYYLEHLGRFYIDRFGSYAGWAHSVLFSTRLKRFESQMQIKTLEVKRI